MKKHLIAAGLGVSLFLSGCGDGSNGFNAEGYAPEGTSIDVLPGGMVPIPHGVLNLSSTAVRNAFATLPPTIEKDVGSQVAVNANVIGDNDTLSGMQGSGFKVGRDLVITAGHVAVGESPTAKPDEVILHGVPRMVGGPSAESSGKCAAGSFNAQNTVSDIGIIRVRTSQAFDQLPGVSYPTREVRPTPNGARAVYIISFQPGADGMFRDPGAANESVDQLPPYLRYPDITAGLLVDATRGVPSGEDLVITGIKSFAEDGRAVNVNGSSGGAVIDGATNRVDGEVTGGTPDNSSNQPELISPAVFYVKFGVRVETAGGVSYTFMQPVDALAVNALAARTIHCQKPLLP